MTRTRTGTVTEADLKAVRAEVADLEDQHYQLETKAEQLVADYRSRGVEPTADTNAMTEVDRAYKAAEQVAEQLAEARSKHANIAGRVGVPMGGYRTGDYDAGNDVGARQWATTAASYLGEVWRGAAITDGSVDVPSLVSPRVVPDPHDAQRVVDLLVDRQVIESHEYSYMRQTARDNQAAPVADEATKPTSTFTVTEVEGRARVVAHLSEATPQRLVADHRELERFLSDEMSEGVLDALEEQLLSGDGTGENFTGLLETVGIQVVTRASGEDELTPLRRARTVARDSHESPSAWVLPTQLVEDLDLKREGTDGMFLSAGPGLANILGGLPVVESTHLDSTDAILADWSMVRLYIRESLRLDVATSGTVGGVDLFSTNQFVMRGEARFGIGVLRPQAFIHIDVTEPA